MKIGAANIFHQKRSAVVLIWTGREMLEEKTMTTNSTHAKLLANARVM
jgi:hypothetical protein